MKWTTRQTLEKYKNVQSGYVALLCYRMANICTFADPVSLLSVTVDIDGSTSNIEEVAQACVTPDKDAIHIFPNNESQFGIIGRAIAEEHPEFIQEIATATIEGDEIQYLRLVIPPVDKQRHDIMLDAINVLHDECDAKLKATTALFTTQISTTLAGATSDDIAEIKKQMQEITNLHAKSCKDAFEAKKQEIEKAFKSYTESKEKKRKEELDKETEKRLQKEVIHSYKIH